MFLPEWSVAAMRSYPKSVSRSLIQRRARTQRPFAPALTMTSPPPGNKRGSVKLGYARRIRRANRRNRQPTHAGAKFVR